jgi:hypothetical protein
LDGNLVTDPVLAQPLAGGERAEIPSRAYIHPVERFRSGGEVIDDDRRHGDEPPTTNSGAPSASARPHHDVGAGDGRLQRGNVRGIALYVVHAGDGLVGKRAAERGDLVTASGGLCDDG